MSSLLSQFCGSFSESSCLKHVAIIPDGNNRWAKRQGVTPVEAYQKGASVIFDVVGHAQKLEIPFVTAYLMSLENLQKRSLVWRTAFFSFVKVCIEKYKRSDLFKQVRLRTIGRLDLLPKDLRRSVEGLVKMSQDHTGVTLSIAVAYTGQDEIIRAVQRFCSLVNQSSAQDSNQEQKQEHQKMIDSLTPEMFESFLDTAGIPAPDLLIRTSGEQRLSGFLLWQLAYTEFVFVSKLWPDFSVADFDEAVKIFRNRQRNFGQERK